MTVVFVGEGEERAKFIFSRWLLVIPKKLKTVIEPLAILLIRKYNTGGYDWAGPGYWLLWLPGYWLPWLPGY